ncbi:MAG: hypothetical protein A3G32_09030 [Deltaproteobacteria bacterium RIFCSPLOWO2_12_FULL_40_28]|nr:MAG: hypothetical protein A3C45_05880 [Deltaproteobacteria bacterium RIFCSPHIGHO2_02_FULL_40_28]OGQ19839.1 MAG: hypothetical protein A3E27_01080 [Deltaproteobacteria bacterium RIFCSPHIGHO2_12_FULL_40_32]OGQ39930.1 MAG: hypothetical protein A3I69_09560 [Deltaproteobacteria bacterium RIFCSPLOWO2_02_FULL_40_36]OGQ54232.1 MAG: hypothetical protein A3G32_09030 [Deltaproteobacteria bacterium RIFCSPLOWO2_12_FULL_40_28]
MDLRIQYRQFLELLEEARIIPTGANPATIILPENEVLLRRLGAFGIPPLTFTHLIEQAEAFRRDQATLRKVLQERTVLMPPGMEALLAAKPTTPEILQAVSQHLEPWEAMVNQASTINWNKLDRIPLALLGMRVLAYRRFADESKRTDLSLTARMVHLTFVRHSEPFTRDEPGQKIVEISKPFFRTQIIRLAEALKRPVPDLTDAHLDAQIFPLQVAGLALEGLAEDRAFLAKARVSAPAKALPLLQRLATDALQVGKIINAPFPHRTDHTGEIGDLHQRLQILQRAIATEVGAATRAAPAAPPPPPTPPPSAPAVPAMNLTQMAREAQLLLDVVNHFPPPINQPIANDLEIFNEPLNDYYEHHRDHGLPQLALASLEPRRLGIYAEYRLSRTAYTPTIEDRFHQAAIRITKRTGLPYTWRELDEFATIGLMPITFELVLMDITTHLDLFPPVTDQNRAQATAVLRKMETVLDVLDRYDQAIRAAGGIRLDRGSRLMQTTAEIRARIKALTKPPQQAPVRQAPSAQASAARTRVTRHLNTLVPLIREGTRLFQNPSFVAGMATFMEPTTNYVDVITEQQRGEACILHGRLMLALITQFQDTLSAPDATLQDTLHRTTMGTTMVARGLEIPFTPPTSAESRAAGVPLIIAELALLGLREDLQTLEAVPPATHPANLPQTLIVLTRLTETAGAINALLEVNFPNRARHTKRIRDLALEVTQFRAQVMRVYAQTEANDTAGSEASKAAPATLKDLVEAAKSIPGLLKPAAPRRTVVPAFPPSPPLQMPIITLAQLLRKAGNNEDLGWWIDLTGDLDATETFAINQWLIEHPDFIANVRSALAEHDEIDWAPIEDALVEHVAGYERIDASEDRTAHRRAMSAKFKEAKKTARVARTIFEA